MNTTIEKPRLIDRLLLGAHAYARGARVAIGEQSELRTPDFSGGFSVSSAFADYRLDSSKVTYSLARALYRNNEDRYKLGAWAAKPVVNTVSGFMGAPRFEADRSDDFTQGLLDEGPGGWGGRFLRVNRNSQRDGDVYVRLLPKTRRFADPGLAEDTEIGMTLIPPEWVDPTFNSLTSELDQVVIKWPILEKTTSDDARRVERQTWSIIETITKTTRILRADDRAPAGAQASLDALMEDDLSNPWGTIPMVHFRNEAEEHALFGMSELEPIEPFMKAYHDVLKAAVGGGRQLARPKTKFVLKDIGKFLRRNFGKEWQRKERLNFANRDVYFLFEGEDAQHIAATFDVAAVTSLLKMLFNCIVDISETPEFAFGTAVASSKASVSEQVPVLGRRVDRKRGEFSDPYAELASLYLYLRDRLGATGIASYRTTVTWDEFSPSDDKDVAEMLRALVSALVDGVNEGLISHEAAVAFAQRFVPTMASYVVEGEAPDARGERERIIDGLTLLSRLRAGETEIEFDDDGRPRLRTVSGQGGEAGG